MPAALCSHRRNEVCLTPSNTAVILRQSTLHHSPTMGFFYRKSIGFGPFRVNLSKSGVGYSVGSRGFRTGVSGQGRKYTTFGIPGTGMGYRTSGGKGCLLLLTVLLVLAALLMKGLQ